MNRDSVLLRHILDSITKIERYTKGMTLDEFVRDDKTLGAVQHELMIIGEAANHLSEEFRSQHPDFPVYEARGMRNRVIHEYWGIDEKIVWDTCKKNLPELKQQLHRIAK